MPKQLVDPITKFVYTATEDGLVEVHDPETDQRGRYNEVGEWKSGDRVYANRQLLGWIGRLSARLAAREPSSST